MAQNLAICSISDDVIKRVKDLRFNKSKTTCALILKVDMLAKEIVVDEEFKDCTIEDLKDELPDRQPRYLIISYVFKHSDGRISYPLCFIFCCPEGGKTEMNMMYTGGRNSIHNELAITKEFKLDSPEELTEEWLEGKLGFFG